MLIKLHTLVSAKWSTLIGRPRLTLIGKKCRNIVCGKDDHFKKYQDDYYICQCGYEIKGQFETIQHSVKLYCAASNCHLSKVKMNLDCIKCESIRERIL